MTARPSKKALRLARRLQVLPRTVEPWMLFTDAGELRHPAFSHGGFADEYHGWTITYDPAGRFYRARAGSQQTGEFFQKAEMYRWCRQNSLTGSP